VSAGGCSVTATAGPIGEGIHSITVGHERGKTLVDGTVLYKRTPNHLNPIKREIATSVPFPEINHGEDWAFMVNVFPMLKSEVFVDEYLYHYYYRMPMAREGERVNVEGTHRKEQRHRANLRHPQMHAV
jgi:hypothetical protein